MSLELLREGVKLTRLIGKDSAQIIVENDIIVPDVKPDIASILLLDADITSVRAEAKEDKVVVNGLINYKILYISDDENQSVKGINAGHNFTHSLDIPDTNPGMRCNAKCSVLHIDYDMIHSRKINTKAIISIDGKVSSEEEYEIAGGVSGIDGVQQLRKSIDINCFIGESRTECNIAETLQLPENKPAIADILRNDVRIAEKEYIVSDDKIIVKGNLVVSTLYIGDDEDGSAQYAEHEIPFSQAVDIPGLSENSLGEVDVDVFDYRFVPAEDDYGELRILDTRIDLAVSAAGFEKRSIEVLEDAYAPKARLDLETGVVVAEDILLEDRSQATVREVMTIDESGPGIREVLSIYCRPTLSEYRVYENKVVIEGVVKNYLLYTSDDGQQRIFCHEQEMPFTHGIDYDGLRPDMICEMDIDLENLSYSVLSGKEVEVREVIGINLKVSDKESISTVVEAHELPADERGIKERPTITIYYAQKGDNLWKIAKKYLTTVDALKKWNDLDDNTVLRSGQQILIFKTAT